MPWTISIRLQAEPLKKNGQRYFVLLIKIILIESGKISLKQKRPAAGRSVTWLSSGGKLAEQNAQPTRAVHKPQAIQLGRLVVESVHAVNDSMTKNHVKQKGISLMLFS